MPAELSAGTIRASEAKSGDVVQYIRYQDGRAINAESKVDRTVEDWDNDGVWAVFMFLRNGHRMVFLPNEKIVVHRYEW